MKFRFTKNYVNKTVRENNASNFIITSKKLKKAVSNDVKYLNVEKIRQILIKTFIHFSSFSGCHERCSE